ncbi:hypothetical protein NDU88_002815 [Pleurodeles waltl]|uniref:Uncharacterized protein n=1 Tax=Pleurodeles waltl TaxID=8319 RepID=A0AAV7TLS8_PLEWA|nr:hypothetical protein NDU88_002815 [Pleurodeles waltl]
MLPAPPGTFNLHSGQVSASSPNRNEPVPSLSRTQALCLTFSAGQSDPGALSPGDLSLLVHPLSFFRLRGIGSGAVCGAGGERWLAVRHCVRSRVRSRRREAVSCVALCLEPCAEPEEKSVRVSDTPDVCSVGKCRRCLAVLLQQRQRRCVETVASGGAKAEIQ